LQVGVDEIGGRFGLVRTLPGRQLEADDPEAVDVRELGKRVSLEMFGTHVPCISEDVPRRRELADLFPSAGQHPGDPEVRQIDPSGLLLEEDVGRFHVAMDDSLPMRRAEPGGDVRENATHLASLEPSLGAHPILEAPSPDVLHDDVRHIAGERSDPVDRDDVGV
jgi:hypothetical protein